MGGVISAGSAETATAGAMIFEQGGNAVDAAVAAAFASFIGEIGVVHLGGSGVAHLYSAQEKKSWVYDFFSNTPGLGGTLPDRMDFGRVMIDFGETTQDFYLGRASVAVPGNIIGLCKLAKEHGTMSLRALLEPTMRMARDGVKMSFFQAETCKLLTPLYTHTDGMREIFLRNGRMLHAGQILTIPHLLETLEEIAEQGETVMRNGRLAQALLQDQQHHGGLLTQTDLEQYEVYIHDSIRIPYRDNVILLPPPSSVGGVLTAFTLRLLSYFNVNQRAHGDVNHLRLIYEAMAATTRARLRWDRGAHKMPMWAAIDEFLSDEFVLPYRDEVYAVLQGKRPSSPITEPPSHPNTSHLSVIDDDGLAVSLTTTAGESAGYVVPGTGFIPNNMLGEADLHPLGFHTRPAGERIPTMMTPTIILKDEQPRLVLGSGGSTRIRSAIMQVVSNLLDYHMLLDHAVNISRVHVEDGVLQCEAGYDPEAADKLEKLGYQINRWNRQSLYFGGAHSVSRTEKGRLVAAGDHRRGGATAIV